VAADPFDEPLEHEQDVCARWGWVKMGGGPYCVDNRRPLTRPAADVWVDSDWETEPVLFLPAWIVASDQHRATWAGVATKRPSHL
jgi:hypothetical protein